MHAYLLHNGEIHATSEKLISPGQVGFMNGWGVFTTIRVYDGVLFAYQRHYERIERDAVRMRVPLDISAHDLEEMLLRLVEANHAANATLRVAIVRNKGGLFEAPGIERAADIVAFTADLNPWGNAVRLMYTPQGRHAASEFAGAKITSWSQNLVWNEEAHERGFDEVILLNEFGQVSECTSANIFIVRGNQVWTPPVATSGCLAGVTRAVLLEDIHIDGVHLEEHDLLPVDLEIADQVFITSTTRDLLPVTEIEGRALNQSPELFGRLKNGFLAYQMEYAALRRKAEAVGP
ncbi:MAG: aminotransferase class IV [Bryobacteraceae bacterium]